jgi:hypothetical protein
LLCKLHEHAEADRALFLITISIDKSATPNRNPWPQPG